MFGIEAVDLVLIIVVAVVLFGPERIPEFSRKAARVIVGLRELANNAQTQLRDELGPEYADMKVQDLNPKAFVKKHLSGEIAAIEAARAELAAAGQTLKDTTNQLSAEADSVKAALESDNDVEPVKVAAVFDTEAT